MTNKKTIPIDLLLRYYRIDLVFVSFLFVLILCATFIHNDGLSYAYPIVTLIIYTALVSIYMFVKYKNVTLINDGKICMASVIAGEIKQSGGMQVPITTYCRLKIQYKDENGIGYNTKCNFISKTIPNNVLVLYSTKNPKNCKQIYSVGLTLVDFVFKKYEQEIYKVEQEHKKKTKKKSTMN